MSMPLNHSAHVVQVGVTFGMFFYSHEITIIVRQKQGKQFIPTGTNLSISWYMLHRKPVFCEKVT